MRIGTREIGPDRPPYIIAELGVNHDGSVERALELTRAAAEAGADAVKLQLFEADRLMSRAAKLAAYQKAAGERDPVEMLRRLELTVEEMGRVVSLAHQLEIHAIVTVFSVELVAEAERLPWDAYKTASPDIVNRPLLEALAATGKPMIVSTGASTLDEVVRAIGWLETVRERLAVMQCVSCYPTPRENAELGGIAALRRVFPGEVGYSDHTAFEVTAVTAVNCGATLLEKHLTHNRRAKGPDHLASLSPEEFRTFVMFARLLYNELSDRPGRIPLKQAHVLLSAPLVEIVKRVLPVEADVRTVSRQSLTTTRDLPAGHRLTRADLTIKRPGTGIPPYELDATIGRSLVRNVEADMPLVADDLN